LTIRQLTHNGYNTVGSMLCSDSGVAIGPANGARHRPIFKRYGFFHLITTGAHGLLELHGMVCGAWLYTVITIS